MEKTQKLTICIISYNRGHCALRQVKSIQNQLGDDIGVLVLDNASTIDTEGYKEIERISNVNQHIKYYRHPINIQAWGNFLACFELAKSPYIQIMSDEDFPCINMLRESIDVLDEFNNLAVLRGSIGAETGMPGRNNIQYEDSFLHAGEAALSNFFLRTNYLSGIIYNKLLITGSGLVDRLKNKLLLNNIYPQMYLDGLCAAMHDVVLTNNIACWEGPEDPMTTGVQNNSGVVASFSARLTQFLAFRDLIIELHEFHEISRRLAISIHLYERLCAKYFYLISCDDFIHIRDEINPKGLQDSLLHFAIAASNIKIFSGYENLVSDCIYKVYYHCKATS